MKFTEYEARAIEPLITASPLLSWVYHFCSVRRVATVFGVVDIIDALLIASRPLFPRLSILGSGIAAVSFAVTSTFVISTPGWAAQLGGFPALSFEVGQVFMKDLVLLGAALWCWSEARFDEQSRLRN
jgi:uncharacterized membrane protein YkgB